ncbi:Scr1 family TA system antitoxin-like transcriptional regulator [Streptomyces sp. NPDC059118]|uniref:Scr1 family TA system antitoxin-like transcriptional regulator n=1 Tax=unclassified Streptomyces TaxID=2593676 RepID=UPI00369FC888
MDTPYLGDRSGRFFSTPVHDSLQCMQPGGLLGMPLHRHEHGPGVDERPQRSEALALWTISMSGGTTAPPSLHDGKWSSQELPGVEIQVLPFSADVHAGIEGAFTVLRFDADDRLSVVEPLTTARYPEEISTWGATASPSATCARER